jgi:hypothetical protein
MRMQAWIAPALSLAVGAAGCNLGPLTTADLFPDASGMMCGAAITDAPAGGADADDDAGMCPTHFNGRVGCACSRDVRDHAACSPGQDLPCYAACGPLARGIQNCTCLADSDGGSTTGVWSCPTCGYDPAPGNHYACFNLPSMLELCPKDGSLLIRHGTPCTRQPCTPCGSTDVDSYRDSGGNSKRGFCVCSNDGKWSCASDLEWPPAWCLPE